MPFPVNLNDGIGMSVSDVHRTKSSLNFSYQITNENANRIYVINELFHRRGAAGFQVDSNVVYASLDVDMTLNLSKQLIDIPDMMKVEAPETPYVTPFESGQSLDESLQLPLPILPKDPYEPQEESETPKSVSSFFFSVGYVIEDEPLEVKPTTLPDGSRHLRPWYSDVVRRQRLRRSGPHNAQISVLIQISAQGS